MYKTFVRPIMESATCVWSPQTTGLVEELEDVQRRFTRSLFTEDNRPEYSTRLQDLNLMSLQNRRRLADLCMCFKIAHGLVELGTQPYRRSTRASRANDLYFIAEHCESNSKVKNSFFYRTIQHFNILPSNIRNITNLNAFKNTLAKSLFMLP